MKDILDMVLINRKDIIKKGGSLLRFLTMIIIFRKVMRDIFPSMPKQNVSDALGNPISCFLWNQMNGI